MSDLSLVILSPRGILFEGECDAAYVPARTGPMGILPGHTPIVAALNEKGGVIRLEMHDGTERCFAVRGGYLSVRPDKTMILSESLREAPSEEEALALLAQLPPLRAKSHSNEDVRLAESMLRKGPEPSGD
jgi:F-type H+-transporting ATPase subunit epsilon